MYLDQLKPPKGAKHKPKRLGRGEGSGLGKTSGRGHKGQKSRKSGNVRIGFEGGQMPMHRRLPKRGFKNVWADKLPIVDVSTLSKKFNEGEVVDLSALTEKGLLHKSSKGFKVLGRGNIELALTVKATKISAGAKAKIEKANGSVELSA